MPKTIIIKMFIQRLDTLRKNLNLIIFNFTFKSSLEILCTASRFEYVPKSLPLAIFKGNIKLFFPKYGQREVQCRVEDVNLDAKLSRNLRT